MNPYLSDLTPERLRQMTIFNSRARFPVPLITWFYASGKTPLIKLCRQLPEHHSYSWPVIQTPAGIWFTAVTIPVIPRPEPVRKNISLLKNQARRHRVTFGGWDFLVNVREPHDWVL